MIELLVKRDWSDDFLIPLTGLRKSGLFKQKSYLFWRENTINDYKLVLTMTSGKYDQMMNYCREVVFPVLDKSGYLLESYDIGDTSIFILDMSEWAMDIELFMTGRYSKMSGQAKERIKKYHKNSQGVIAVQLMAVLYPREIYPVLDNMCGIDYVCRHYGLDWETVNKGGEIGSLYNEGELLKL